MIPSDPPEFNRPSSTARPALKPRAVTYRKPVWYAVYYPYGVGTRNTLGVSVAEIDNGAGGQQADVVTSFLYRSERDRYVATDPEHIAAVPSRDPVLRRELRMVGHALYPCICEGEYRQDCPADECPAYLEAVAAKEAQDLEEERLYYADLEAQGRAAAEQFREADRAYQEGLEAVAQAADVAADLAYDANREARAHGR